MQANILCYKTELNNLKKDNLTMSNYRLKVKNLVDSLRYSRYVFASYDYVMYILVGLGSEYDPFVMTTNAKCRRSDAYTVEKVSSLLIALEKRVYKSHVENISVNFARNTKENFGRNSFGGEGGYKGRTRIEGQNYRCGIEDYKGGGPGRNSRGTYSFRVNVNKP